jgi:IMP dehydrogenase
MDRARALIDAGADVLVIDTAHGHSDGVLQTTALVRETFPDVQLVVGNVASREGAAALVERGVDAVKVGVGPGSICTTRVVTGVGVPQLTAIFDAVEGAGDVPVIADGGVKYSGDIVKALAAGASSVMRVRCSRERRRVPANRSCSKGRRFKMIRGMGSLSAMQDGSADRYSRKARCRRRSFSRGHRGPCSVQGTRCPTSCSRCRRPAKRDGLRGLWNDR